MKHLNRANHYLVFFILLVLPLTVILTGQDIPADENTLIKVTFINNSDQDVMINTMTFDNVVSSQPLVSRSQLVLDIPQGQRIRLDYAPCPKQTLLSPLGSVNELNRTITIQNDGENLFIQERFSGQLHKGKGEKRQKQQTISEPEAERSPQCADPNQPQNKTDQIKLIDPKELKELQGPHTTRVEDPTKPAPKEQVEKTEKDKKKLKEKKDKVEKKQE